MKSSFSLIALFLAGTALMAGSPGIVGDYVEVRSNHVYTCGCLYSGELVTGGREVVLAWNVREGEFSGVPLQGFKVVAVIVGDANLSLGRPPRKAALYLDGVSSAREQQAALEWLRSQYSTTLGEVVAVKTSPIEFSKAEGGIGVEVDGVLRLNVRKARLPEDAHLGSYRWYDPLVQLEQPEMSTVVLSEYWGNDFPRNWRRYDSGISAYTGEFGLN